LEIKKGKNTLFVVFDKKENFKQLLFAIFQLLPVVPRLERK